MPDNDDTDPRQPWSTGQGIGFLVMLPGLIVIAAAVAAMLVTVAVLDDPDEIAVGLISGCGAMLVGLLAAVPGMIVFFKCKP